MNAKQNEDLWLSTMEIARRYGIGIDVVRLWRKFEGFPKTAVVRESNVCSWNVVEVDAWLRQRPVPRIGRPAKWRSVVGYQQAASA